VGRSIFKTQGLHIDQLSLQDLPWHFFSWYQRSRSRHAPCRCLSKDVCCDHGAERGREN